MSFMADFKAAPTEEEKSEILRKALRGLRNTEQLQAVITCAIGIQRSAYNSMLDLGISDSQRAHYAGIQYAMTLFRDSIEKYVTQEAFEGRDMIHVDSQDSGFGNILDLPEPVI